MSRRSAGAAINTRRLTERQGEVLRAIREHIAREGQAPSRSEIAKALELKNQSAVDTHLQALARKGWIQIEAATARGIKILADDIPILDLDEVPIVSAGTPRVALDGQPQTQMRTLQALWNRFERTPDYFVVVEGDSMDRVGYRSGDIVAVRRDPDPRHKDIVIARLGDEITLKRFMRSGDGALELHPDSTNPKHKVISIEPETDFEIAGVVVGGIIGTDR